MRRNALWLTAAGFCGVLIAYGADAQKKYGPGATDTEIKIGQTMPYSGPASAYGVIGKAEAAYFRMVNDNGGIGGRKINFISLDDGYSPPRTVEQTRKLVEQDGVLLDFSALGTPTNTAIRKYMNMRKVPQIFVATGATKWGDYKHYPWTMGWQPPYQMEGRAYARYILDKLPNAKIGILYQNDDYGKDYVKGLKDGLGAKAASMIVKEVTYETTDPTVNSQIASLQSSGANVFYNVTTPKFAAQAIRAVYNLRWKPVQFLNSVSNSVGAVLQPAGLDASKGIISVQYIKDPTDPTWQNDPGFKKYNAFLDKYMPGADKNDIFLAFGYSEAQTMAQVLKQCGDDLTRANIMRQATNLHDLALPMLLPGITVSTSPTDHYPIKHEQLSQFNGKRWQLFGNVLALSLASSK